MSIGEKQQSHLLLPDEIGEQKPTSWHYGIVAKKVAECDTSWGSFGKAYVYSKSTGRNGGVSESSTFFAEFEVASWIKFRSEKDSARLLDAHEQRDKLCRTRMVSIEGRSYKGALKNTIYLAQVRTTFFITPPWFLYARTFINGKNFIKVWSPTIGAGYAEEEVLSALQIIPGQAYNGWFEFADQMNFAPFCLKANGDFIDRSVSWKLLLEENLDEPIDKMSYCFYQRELSILNELGRDIEAIEAQQVVEILSRPMEAIYVSKPEQDKPTKSEVFSVTNQMPKTSAYKGYLQDVDYFRAPFPDFKTAFRHFYACRRWSKAKRVLKKARRLQNQEIVRDMRIKELRRKEAGLNSNKSISKQGRPYCNPESSNASQKSIDYNPVISFEKHKNSFPATAIKKVLYEGFHEPTNRTSDTIIGRKISYTQSDANRTIYQAKDDDFVKPYEIRGQNENPVTLNRTGGGFGSSNNLRMIVPTIGKGFGEGPFNYNSNGSCRTENDFYYLEGSDSYFSEVNSPIIKYTPDINKIVPCNDSLSDLEEVEEQLERLDFESSE